MRAVGVYESIHGGKRECNDYYNTTIMASMRFGVSVIKVRGRMEELSKLRELRSPRPVLR
jgi:hypothetical protein